MSKLSQEKALLNSAKASLVLSALLTLAVSQSATPARAQSQPGPRTFYVSRAAMECNNDGSSWGKAWPELSRIDWSKVKPGDTIKIDGGAFAMVYAGPLKVGADGTQSAPIKIVSADEPGRNGTVQIAGYGRRITGVDVGDHHDVVIQGRKWNSIMVYNFKGDGVSTGPSSDRVKLKNMTIALNGDTTGGVGLRLQGGENSLEQLMVNDNSVNIDVYCTKGYFGPKINRCYVTNRLTASNRIYKADGIRFNDVRSSQQHLYISNSVIGPGLATGIKYGLRNSMVHISNNLFINAATANIVKVHRSLPDYYYTTFNLSNNTFFMTPLNAFGAAHSTLDFVQGQDMVFSNIAYGGAVAVTMTPQSVSGRATGNVQFKTSGNTVFLAPTQVDPQFVSNVGQLPNNVSVTTLGALDYAVRSGSPAAGKGSKITSVQQLLSTNQ